MQDEIYKYAITLLGRREYSVQQLKAHLENQFGSLPIKVIEKLIAHQYVDDQRFAETYVRKRKSWGRRRLENELMYRGVTRSTVAKVIESEKWPSLKEVIGIKMKTLKVTPPLSNRDASRLFRSLLRLGYEEEAIQHALDNLS